MNVHPWIFLMFFPYLTSKQRPPSNFAVVWITTAPWFLWGTNILSADLHYRIERGIREYLAAIADEFSLLWIFILCAKPSWWIMSYTLLDAFFFFFKLYFQALVYGISWLAMLIWYSFERFPLSLFRTGLPYGSMCFRLLLWFRCLVDCFLFVFLFVSCFRYLPYCT